MRTCCAQLPLCASEVRVQVNVLVPKPPRCQQSGVPSPLLSVSSDGFLNSCEGGQDTGGFSEPPMTVSMTTTVVPRETRGASQSRKAIRLAGEMEYCCGGLHGPQMWWKTMGTQPPPEFSALVT